MNTRLDWGDFAVVLLIAEAGSIAAAARHSSDSRPTLARRLNAIESRLGARVFDRLRSGYVTTAAGEQVVAAARRMRRLAVDAEQAAGDLDRRPAGKVSLATTDTIYEWLLAPELQRLQEALPGVVLDIHTSNRIRDLDQREADIALRPTMAPQENLVGRRIGVIRQAVYARTSAQEGDPAKLPAICASDSMPYPALHEVMRQQRFPERCVLQLNSIQAMYRAAKLGLGAAILPTYVGDADRELTRHGEPIAALDTDLWLLTTFAIRNTARVRGVLDFIAANSTLRKKLAG